MQSNLCYSRSVHLGKGFSKKENHPVGVVFLFVTAHRLCCLHSRASQGRGSVRGEPLTGSPTRVQSPARRRPLLRSKSGAPKKKDTHVSVFLFWSGRRGSTRSRHPANGRAIRRNPAFTSGFNALRAGRGSEFNLPATFQKEKPPRWGGFLFGAGDEARTRYLDLGKVALYQMSYARKRKTHYTANWIPCQPCLSFSRKISARPFRGGKNRLNASRSPPRRHWRRWDRSSSPSRCRRWRSAPAARSAAPGTPARQRH